VIEMNLGVEEPNVLADNFIFSSPLVGQISKKDFLVYQNKYNIKTGTY
jgi:hypothetical protein